MTDTLNAEVNAALDAADTFLGRQPERAPDPDACEIVDAILAYRNAPRDTLVRLVGWHLHTIRHRTEAEFVAQSVEHINRTYGRAPL